MLLPKVIEITYVLHYLLFLFSVTLQNIFTHSLFFFSFAETTKKKCFLFALIIRAFCNAMKTPKRQILIISSLLKKESHKERIGCANLLNWLCEFVLCPLLFSSRGGRMWTSEKFSLFQQHVACDACFASKSKGLFGPTFLGRRHWILRKTLETWKT